MPTYLMDWHWALFMVIAKAKQTGNWWQLSSIGRDSAEGSNVILGMKTTLPGLLPPNMQHLRNIVLTFNNTMHMLLQRLLLGSRLRSNMRGHPGFRAIHAKGSPETLRELRNSTGYMWELSLLTLSTLIWMDSSPEDKIEMMDRSYIWTNIPIKDHLIKLINSIILREEDGVFQKELVWHIALIYAWIYCIDQTFNAVLRKAHVGRKEYGLIRREVWTCTNL